MTACALADPANPESRSPDWTLRAYQPGDERQIVRLFRDCFHRPISETHWLWKLRSGGAAENVWVAEARGRIIGHHAGIPVRVWLNGQEQQAIVAVDSMMHPDHRGRWVFTKLVRHAHHVWASSGFSFLLGMPNQNWGAAHKKRLGIGEIFPLTWKVRPLDVEHFLAKRLHLPLLRSVTLASAAWNRLWERKQLVDETVELAPVTHAGPEFDQLWQAVRPHIRASIIRDSNWVNWRYLASPEKKYQVLLATQSGSPVGYLAYRIAEDKSKVALLAELFTSPSSPHMYTSILARSVRVFRRHRVHAAITLAIPDTPNEKLLKRTGFRFGRGGCFEVCLIPFASHLDQTVYDRNAWCMAGGDFDVV